jgi:hypothetical protein
MAGASFLSSLTRKADEFDQLLDDFFGAGNFAAAAATGGAKTKTLNSALGVARS